jgi:hypothetical protein
MSSPVHVTIRPLLGLSWQLGGKSILLAISDISLSQRARSFSASYVATSTDFTAFLSAPARHHFIRGNRVGPEEDALAVVNG